MRKRIKSVKVRRQIVKIISGDVMTRVPAREAEERESLGTRLTVRLSRLSLAIYSGKVPGFTYCSST